MPAAFAAETITLPFNDPDKVEDAFAAAGDDIAAVILEPVAGNMGCIPPVEGYLERLREIGNCPVGYSGHERGIHIAVAAVAFVVALLAFAMTYKNMNRIDQVFAGFAKLELLDALADVSESSDAIRIMSTTKQALRWLNSAAAF